MREIPRLRFLVVLVAMISTVVLRSQTTVDFATDFANGWSEWIGQTVTFSNDFYLTDTYGRKVAYTRLRAPEEFGEEGTPAYEEAVTHNEWASCSVYGLTLNSDYRPGTIIRGLTARVTAANKLQAVNTPTIVYNELPTLRPSLGNTNLVVCVANVQNFFVTLGGYAGADTPERLLTQKTKISKALHHMQADIYALCEVEEGPLAVTELVRLLNELEGAEVYTWINAGFPQYDAVMVCYIYRKDKIKTYGKYLWPYNYAPMKYREAIQCFEHIESGERFNLALNHFYAKVSKDDADRQDNMKKLIQKLATAIQNDPDVLVVGDLNAYTNEESNLLLSRDQDYVDLLMKYDPEGYSYVYNGVVGYLDHAYCSPSMESQVTYACSYHLNADTRTNLEFWYGDTSMYRYADHDPILVGLNLGNETGIETPAEEKVAYKTIRHGQLIIIRGGETFTITGQRIPKML